MRNNHLLLLTTFIVSCLTFTSCQYLGLPEDFNPLEEKEKREKKEAFNKEMDASIDKMMKAMMEEEMTGDPDLDFAHMMIHHHIGGVEVSDIELKYGKHPEAKQIAEKSKKGNQESTKRLEAFIADHGDPKPVSEETYKEFMEKMDMLMMQMDKVMRTWPSTSDADYDFAEILIHHHQGAVEMSELELEFGKDEMAREEAQTIITEQEKEITQLGEFRQKHGRPSF
jgi:uncharacterized protein (DUF305 family)